MTEKGRKMGKPGETPSSNFFEITHSLCIYRGASELSSRGYRTILLSGATGGPRCSAGVLTVGIFPPQ